MTTRHKGFTVVLARDAREDDDDEIMTALRMVRGVLEVIPIESTHDDSIVRMRVDSEWRDRILEMLRKQSP
jgi:hypothetical protein